MTDQTHDSPPPTLAPILRLPREILTLILVNLWPDAVHVEARPHRPTDFRQYYCHTKEGQLFTARDMRKMACAGICAPGYYDYVYAEEWPDEWERWYSRKASGWRNHFICEMIGKKRVGNNVMVQSRSKTVPPSDFMPVLLTCRALYELGLPTIGQHVEFSFTDLWTPLEFFVGERAAPVASYIRALNLSANPSVPQSSITAWPRFLELLLPGRFANLREVSLWLELTQPVPDLAPDGGEEFKTLVRTLEALELADTLTLRVSVPLDPLEGASAEAISLEGGEKGEGKADTREGVGVEERLANGVVIRRRGQVLQHLRNHGGGISNEWGAHPPVGD